MSIAYGEFKKNTIESSEVINKACNMRAVSAEFAEGFRAAMWEAREIYMRLEDEKQSEEQV